MKEELEKVRQETGRKKCSKDTSILNLQHEASRDTTEII